MLNFRSFLISVMAPITLVLARIVSTPTANLSYFFLAVFALFGRVQAIQALALSWFFTMISPGLGAEATFGSIGRYAVLAAAAVSVFYRSNLIITRTPVKPMTFATLLLGLFFVIHSFIFSPIVDVSVFKALSWTLAMTTLIASWSGLNDDERTLLEKQIFGGLALLMLASLPLLALPLGYLRNGSGFQGVLNHPQAFGPTMALLGAWAAGQMFGQEKPSWSAVALVAACLVLIVLSEARTAGLALVLGVGAAVAIAPGLSGSSIRELLPGLRSRRVHLLIAVGMAGAILAGPQLSARIGDYIAKRGETATLAGAYEVSRGQKIEQMFGNIKEKPLQGIGFGIASNPSLMDIQRDPILGLPTGAAIEKGVLPLAILEEVGILGFVAVAAWVWLLLRRSSLGGVTSLAVTITALVMNMGESTLFSPGGMGLLPLILLGWAFASGQKQEARQ